MNTENMKSKFKVINNNLGKIIVSMMVFGIGLQCASVQLQNYGLFFTGLGLFLLGFTIGLICLMLSISNEGECK